MEEDQYHVTLLAESSVMSNGSLSLKLHFSCI